MWKFGGGCIKKHTHKTKSNNIKFAKCGKVNLQREENELEITSLDKIKS